MLKPNNQQKAIVNIKRKRLQNEDEEHNLYNDSRNSLFSYFSKSIYGSFIIEHMEYKHV